MTHFTQKHIFSARATSMFLALLSFVAVCLATTARAQLPNSFKVTVDKGEGVMVELDLSKYSIRSADCRVVSWDSTNGYVEEHTAANPNSPSRTYRGFVTQNPNELAFASIKSDNTMTVEVHDGAGLLWRLVDVNVATELASGTATLHATAAHTVQTGSAVAANLPGQYVPPVGLYRAHGVEDIPSSIYDGQGQNLIDTLVWVEHQWNVFDFFNARDGKLSMELTEVIVRKEQFYTPENGNPGQFASMLRTEWGTQGQKKRGFIHSWFPNNFAFAGGYAIGNDFYNAGGESVSVNALYHEVGHNWRAQHFLYGKETMTGSHPSHGEINTQRVLYTRQIQIDQNDGIELLTSYATNIHPRAYADLASTSVNTAVNVSPLANDYDANGDVISLKSFTATTAKGGTVTQAGDVLTYTPATGYVGKDIVVYEVQDASGLYTKGLIHIEVINGGLVAKWSMEETSGTTLADASGHNHPGALNGTDMSVSSVDSPNGKGLSLGASAYMVGDSSDLITGSDRTYPIDEPVSSFFDPMDESYTVASWVRLDAASDSAKVFSKNNRSNLGYQVVADRVTGFTATVRLWDGIESALSVSSGQSLLDDTWYHVAMVINRSDNTLRLYVNGAEVGTAATLPAGFFIFNGRDDFKLGGAGAVSVDEVHIYTKALTVSEVQALYAPGDLAASALSPVDDSLNQIPSSDLTWQAGRSRYLHDVYFGISEVSVAAATTASPEYKGRQSATTYDPGELDIATAYFWRIDEVDGGRVIPGKVWKFTTSISELNAGLILHLTMDNQHTLSSGGSVVAFDDLAVPSNDFEAVNATTGVAGVIGQAVNLNGADDYLRSYEVNPIQRAQSAGMTISFWFNSSDQEFSFTRVYDAGGQIMMNYFLGDVSVVFSNASISRPVHSTRLNDGQWHHVVATHDGNNTARVYVDGNHVGSHSEGLADIGTLGERMAIGSAHNSSGGNVKASIDDFAVWQRELTLDEIRGIRTEGLAGRSQMLASELFATSFEDTDGYTITDTDGLSVLGTVTDNGGATVKAGSDAFLWSGAGYAIDGNTSIVLGLFNTSSNFEIAFPGTEDGVGSVTFDYASAASTTNSTFELQYNANDGNGWVTAWSTHVVGSTPSRSNRPWGTVEVGLNIPGDVDLRFTNEGAQGVLIDYVRVTSVPGGIGAKFTTSTFSEAPAQTGVSYSESIADNAIGSGLTFSKESGPAWLSVAADGTISGTPTGTNLGENSFTVKLVDENAKEATAVMTIQVVGLFSDDFERTAGTTIDNGWIEVLNDSRIYDTRRAATKLLHSVNSGELYAVVNSLSTTYQSGLSYQLSWNGSRGTSATGSMNYKVSLGTWDGSTFTAYSEKQGNLGNLNINGKVAGPKVAYAAGSVANGEPIAMRFEVLSGSDVWAGFDDIDLTVFASTDLPDTDADQLNDAWEIANFGETGTVTETSDTDGDGFNSFAEMVFGLNPNTANTQADVVREQVIDDAGTDKLEVRFRRPLNHANLNVGYQLQSSTTLASESWGDDATVSSSTTPDADGVTEWVTFRFTLSDAPKRFYQMRTTANP